MFVQYILQIHNARWNAGWFLQTKGVVERQWQQRKEVYTGLLYCVMLGCYTGLCWVAILQVWFYLVLYCKHAYTGHWSQGWYIIQCMLATGEPAYTELSTESNYRQGWYIVHYGPTGQPGPLEHYGPTCQVGQVVLGKPVRKLTHKAFNKRHQWQIS